MFSVACSNFIIEQLTFTYELILKHFNTTRASANCFVCKIEFAVFRARNFGFSVGHNAWQLRLAHAEKRQFFLCFLFLFEGVTLDLYEASD